MTFRIGLLSAVENVIGRRRVAVSIAEAKRAPGRHPGLSHVTIFCLCLFQREALLGQTSPATLPNARISTGGRVRAIALQNDGKVIIGGRFESVNGIPRNNIARINVNGSLDQAWNPSPIDMNVKVLAIGGTNVFVGGRFVGLGLQTGLAKLSATETGARDA